MRIRGLPVLPGNSRSPDIVSAAPCPWRKRAATRHNAVTQSAPVLVVDKLPKTRTARHQTFLRERFSTLLFTPEQLGQSVELAVKDYIDSLQGTENAMPVKIRADILGLPQGSLPQFATQEAMARAFQSAVEAAGRRRNWTCEIKSCVS